MPSDQQHSTWTGGKQQSPLSDALINNKSSTLAAAAAARTMLKCNIICYFWICFFFFSFIFRALHSIGNCFLLCRLKRKKTGPHNIIRKRVFNFDLVPPSSFVSFRPFDWFIMKVLSRRCLRLFILLFFFPEGNDTQFLIFFFSGFYSINRQSSLRRIQMFIVRPAFM